MQEPPDTPAAPQGVVTLMFTDVEGSTRRWEKHAERFGAALQHHDGLVRAAVAHHRGFVVKAVGDGFMVAFARAADAVRCAVDIQTALSDAAARGLWQAVDGLEVRIGLHTGEPAFRGDDYFGPPVNRAARICEAGRGGMIVLSEETARRVSLECDEVYDLEDRGVRQLKDLVPERLFVLHVPGAPAAPAGDLRTLEALPHNFPAQTTSFVGRDQEMRDLTDMLGRHRLVTITGPGGTGKTRLAMQVAADRVQGYPNGVWLVELAGVSDHDTVAGVIALALGIPLQPEGPPIEHVVAHLRGHHALLVLDNFEQVAPAAPLVARMLRECPNLTCLVTSRELLHIAGEAEYALEPLGVPPPDPSGDPAAYGSMQLFVERCRAFRPDFAATGDAAEAVAEICRRLDGIPLAIELAAARIRALAPQQILQRLTRRFDLLSSSQRDLPERQRTLRGAIDWSYDLLSEDERGLFGALSVFVGSFRLEAAEEVCGQPDVLDLLFSLRDKSLIRVREAAGETRFSMLETLREYASQRLRESGDLPRLRTAHAAHFLRYAQACSARLDGAGSEAEEATHAFTLDIDNARAGMDWAAETEDARSTVEYGKSLARFMLRRGLHAEGDTRLAIAVDAARQLGDQPSLARLLNQRGLIAWQQSDFARAGEWFRESLAISRTIGDQPRVLATLINLGNIAWGQADFGEARSLWEEALAAAAASGQARYEAILHIDLGMLACDRGDLDAAERHVAQGLDLHRRSQAEEGIAFALLTHAKIHRVRGRRERALECLEESGRLFASLDHQRGIVLAGVQTALNLLDAGVDDRPGHLAEEALRKAREMGDRHCEMYALDALAQVAAARGDREAAETLARASFAIASGVGDRKHQADILCRLGRWLLDGGRPEEAYALVCVAHREYAAHGLADACVARNLVTEAAAALGSPRADEIERRCAVLSPDDVLAPGRPA